MPRLLLRVLGRVELSGQQRPLTAQQLSFVALLVTSGPVGRSAIVDALWDGRRISDRRVANLIGDVRSVLGRTHLPEPTDGRYRILGIGTDVDRVRAIGAAAAHRDRDRPDRPSAEDERPVGAGGPVELAELADHLAGMLRGVPFGDLVGRHWTWVDDRPALVFEAEEAVVEATRAVTARLVDAGQPTPAVRLVQAAVACCPDAVELTTDLVGLHLLAGRPRAARLVVEAWEGRIARLGCGPAPDGPRLALRGGQASSGSAVTTRLPR
ncbi:MAG: hypothetical protein AAF547_15845 [Actinomycetota bacterium]